METCINWLVSATPGSKQVGILAHHLTIGETYFFREQNTLDALERHILPALIRTRQQTDKQLRIWSAGCCTGEEPYTIAMLLDRMLPNPQEWHINILATDLNPHFLQKAGQGIYREWSFRQTPNWVKTKYFTQMSDGRYEILPRIRQMVTFSSLNLKGSSYPSLLNHTTNLDIILCRNVLMYFSQETIEQITQRMHHSLVDGGWFIPSLTETSHLLDSAFTPVTFSGATLYQKVNNQSKQPVEPLRQWPNPNPTPLVYNALVETIPDQILLTEPEYVPSYQKAADLYRQGHYQAVAQELEAMFAPDYQPTSTRLPAEERAIVLLIQTYANLGQFAEAQIWCKHAITTDKLNPIYYYLLAIMLQEQGELEQAEKTLSQALFLNPSFALAHFAMAGLSRQQGKFTAASKHLRNALAVLDRQASDEVLVEADGLTAGKLKEMIALLQ